MTARLRVTVVAAFALCAIATSVFAQKPAKPADNYDELYNRYLQAARALEDRKQAASTAWMTGLFLDPRARSVNDLVTIRIVESISASGKADSALTKDSAGSASVSKLFGIEKKLPGIVDPTALANTASDTTFKGAGATTRTADLTAIVTARVSEVLPNGDLVVEGVHEIDINGDRQIIVLTGVVRPFDLSAQNVVLSPQVGQLSIRYFGRGLMKDNLKPGWLIRILNKVF